MNELSLVVYALMTAALLVKAIVAIAIQGAERLNSRRFRYAEDAAHWQGEVNPDTERCERAQRLLRNDAETQPYVLALAAMNLAVAPKSLTGPSLLVLYTVSRWFHGIWLLRGRQPHRNRAFAAGVVFAAALAVETLVRAALAL